MAPQATNTPFTFTETWETINGVRLFSDIEFNIPGTQAHLTIHRDPIDTINLRYANAIHVREGSTLNFSNVNSFTAFSIVTDAVNTSENTIEFIIQDRATLATTSLREVLPLSPTAPSAPRVYTAPAGTYFVSMDIVVREQGGILIRTIKWR